MAKFTKSAAVAVVEKSMRDMGRVQTTMTGAAVVALLSGMTGRDLRDMLSSGVNAIGDGMIGKLVPLAGRVMGDYSADVSDMTAAAARDHIAADIETRKIAAGNFNAFTCRAKGEYTPAEKRAEKVLDDHVSSLEILVVNFNKISSALPEGSDPAERLNKAATEAESAIAQANKIDGISLDNTETLNLAIFAPVVAKLDAAVALAEAIRDDMAAETVETVETVEDDNGRDASADLFDELAKFQHNAAVLKYVRETVAEYEANIAAAAAAAAEATAPGATDATENRGRVAS